MSVFDIIKRLGAIIVILILIVMMSLIFSVQPIDEVLSTITGRSSIGTFGEKSITAKDYVVFENYCRNWMAKNKLGEQQFFLENCIERRMRQSYSLLKIGERLGIQIDAETIKKTILKQAKEQYEQQAELETEDKQSLDSIYRYSLSTYPMNLRLHESVVQDTYAVLSKPFPQEPEQDQWPRIASQTTMNLRVVYFNDSILGEPYKAKVKVSDAEIKALWQKEQSKKQDDNKKTKTKPPTAKLRKNLRERIKNDKIKKRVAELRASLNALFRQDQKGTAQKSKNKDINKIAKVSGVAILDLGRVNLNQLNAIKIPTSKAQKAEKQLDLLQKDFLEHLHIDSKSQVIGPIQSGSYTIYAEIKQLYYAGLTSTKQKKEIEEVKQNNKITDEFVNYVMEEEGRRANFKIRHPQTTSQTRR